jgi:hypothetical protein
MVNNKVLKICNSYNQIIYSMLVLVNYHKDTGTFFGIGRVRAFTCWVSMYRWICIRREVEETLSGVYMVNIHE